MLKSQKSIVKADVALKEIIAIKDIGEVIQVAKDASALEAAILRSGKFVGRYYEVARRMLWAEWHGGGLLKQIERKQGERTDLTSFQPGRKLGLSDIVPDKLKPSTAYRWMLMNWAPQAKVQEYMDVKQGMKQPLLRGDLVAMGKSHRPVEVPKTGKDYRVIHADLLDTDIEDDSVDCIITDPPYPEEFIPEYDKLGALAARVLKPGGSCLAMAGHYFLPQVLPLLCKHLTYHWMIAYLTPGAHAQIFPRKVFQGWKPVLWFVKGNYDTSDWRYDVVKSDAEDKTFHEWGQSESGFKRLVEHFTKPNELVLDPFVGGGTTAVVALRLGRRFVGIDSDENAVNDTLARIGGLNERSGEIREHAEERRAV